MEPIRGVVLGKDIIDAKVSVHPSQPTLYVSSTQEIPFTFDPLMDSIYLEGDLWLYRGMSSIMLAVGIPFISDEQALEAVKNARIQGIYGTISPGDPMPLLPGYYLVQGARNVSYVYELLHSMDLYPVSTAIKNGQPRRHEEFWTSLFESLHARYRRTLLHIPITTTTLAMRAHPESRIPPELEREIAHRISQVTEASLPLEYGRKHPFPEFEHRYP